LTIPDPGTGSVQKDVEGRKLLQEQVSVDKKH